MKNLIIIILLLASSAYGGDNQITQINKISFNENYSGRIYQEIDLRIVCVDGYKYLIVTPDSPSSQSGISVTQLMQRIDVHTLPV